MLSTEAMIAGEPEEKSDGKMGGMGTGIEYPEFEVYALACLLSEKGPVE